MSLLQVSKEGRRNNFVFIYGRRVVRSSVLILVPSLPQEKFLADLISFIPSVQLEDAPSGAALNSGFIFYPTCRAAGRGVITLDMIPTPSATKINTGCVSCSVTCIPGGHWG